MKPIRLFIAFAILATLVPTGTASAQYRKQWGQPYRPGYYQRPYGSGYKNPYPPRPQTQLRKPASADSTFLVRNNLGDTQPVINTRTPQVAKSIEDFQRIDFRNPSLELLKQLGEMVPRAGKGDTQSYPRLTGEFEPQKAILLSVSDLMPQHHDVLKQIIQKTSQRIPLVVLVNDKQQLKTVVELASEVGGNLEHLSLLQLPLNTIWLRDFGPRFMELQTGAETIDFLYDGTRPRDDKFPASWSSVSGDRNRNVSWTLQGGNLISNGNGLAVTTTRLFEDNMIRFPNPLPGMNVEYERRKIVVENFKEECNVDQLIFLHPVAPEATRHVDMFAAFLAKDHIVVAEVDPRRDAYNARVLDLNAKLLSSLTVDGSPMRVDRIPIPPREGKFWSPYTNVILANDLLLMPVYQNDSREISRRAIETYQRLLPDVTVETIDMTSMKKLEGALHCMSINIPEFARLPQSVIPFSTAAKMVGVNSVVSANRLPRVNQLDPPQQSTAPKSQVRLSGPANNNSVNAQPNNAQSNTTSRFQEAEQNVEQDDPQRQAASTYRRTFVDSNRQFSLEAVAVGINRRQVYLMRVSDRTIVRVEIGKLSEEDQQWLDKNATKIQANGQLVRNFYEQNGF
ncbi:MAG: agmatine deiminase family protein [Planctomycetota bacterium]